MRTLDAAMEEVRKELLGATMNHGKFASAHEGYAILLEEVDELWDEVKKRHKSNRRMRAEASQVAAMAIRFMIDITSRRE